MNNGVVVLAVFVLIVYLAATGRLKPLIDAIKPT